MNFSPIVTKDMDYILSRLHPADKFDGSTVLVTGCAGFLGYYVMHFLCGYADRLGIKRVIGLDNFLLGRPEWIDRLASLPDSHLQVCEYNIISDDLASVPESADAKYVLHMASIASPPFYRRYPIETLEANVFGLKRLLDYFKDKPLKGFVFFSSSEVYGDPFPEYIPTDENYRGNVATIGPRACYDEAKRFGETMCYLYSLQHGLPIAIVRPFNNFGPGLSLNDGRLPADFARAVMDNKDLIILSDGSPTRTFCYVADAVVGYLTALLYGEFDYFNIGNDKPEISVRELAEIYRWQAHAILGYNGAVKFEKPAEKEYLLHNPQRRCPDIGKARRLLGYDPTISVEDGVSRYLTFLNAARGTT
jgi:UDP-glucuronate decarboxylase